MTDMGEGCAALLAFVAIFIFGGFVGGCVATKVERDSAVEAKAGRWVIDPKTGESRFEYGMGTTPTRGAKP